MRVLRRASVVMSLMLLVAVSVGFFGRRAELLEARDQRTTLAAELASAEVDGVVDVVEAAAMTAGSAAQAIEVAVGSTSISGSEGVSVCATDGATVACEGPIADPGELAGAAPGPAMATVGTRDDLVVIESAGPAAAIWLAVPADTWSRSDVDVRLTTLEPAEGVGARVEHDGVRQTSAALNSVDGYVIASVAADVSFPLAEARFYAVITLLALLLLALAGTTIVIEHRALHEQATIDRLTQLPNRNEFERIAPVIIESARRSGTGLCLLLFDLNGFKQINDTYGHRAGDELLRVVGRRLHTAVRAHDLVARWGGDEFVVIMPGVDSEEMGVRRARQIAEQIAERVRLDAANTSVRVHASVGVALCPQHAGDATELLAAADSAMYRAKRDETVSAVAGRPSAERVGVGAPTLAPWPPSTIR